MAAEMLMPAKLVWMPTPSDDNFDLLRPKYILKNAYIE
jgi:hypothetical protein